MSCNDKTVGRDQQKCVGLTARKVDPRLGMQVEEFDSVQTCFMNGVHCVDAGHCNVMFYHLNFVATSAMMVLASHSESTVKIIRKGRQNSHFFFITSIMDLFGVTVFYQLLE